MSNNGWTFEKAIALLGLIAAVLALVFTVATPELRNYFGLKDDKPPAPAPQPEIKPATPQGEAVPAEPSKPAERSTIQPQPAAPKKKEPVAKPKPPSGPFSATLHENQPHFIEAAKTDLSISFKKELGIVTIIITPTGKEQITLPTVGIGSQEFASSTGVFLVHVLNVDWNSRTVTVQVSQKL